MYTMYSYPFHTVSSTQKTLMPTNAVPMQSSPLSTPASSALLQPRAAPSPEQIIRLEPLTLTLTLRLLACDSRIRTHRDTTLRVPRSSPLPLLLGPPLPLRAIIQQESQCAAERQNHQALEDVGVDLVGVVAVAAVEVIFVVVWLVVVPSCEFGFEEGGEPF